MTPILVRVLAITGMLFFSAMSQHAIAQDSANLPYMNPQLSPEQRATDLVGRMTLAEKGIGDAEQLSCSAAAQNSGVPVVERSSPRRDQRRRDGVSRASRARSYLRRAGYSHHGCSDRRRRPHQARAESARGPHRHHGRPRFLVSQPEHLPRPALGPRAGDLRRRSVPHCAYGRGIRDRLAGR